MFATFQIDTKYGMLKQKLCKNSVIKVCLDISHITVTAWTDIGSKNVYLRGKRWQKKVDECINTLHALIYKTYINRDFFVQNVLKYE